MGSGGENSGETARRRTDGERQAIVTEAFEDGAVVSEVADRHGVSTASIYLWRRRLRDGAIGAVRHGTDQPHPPSPVTLVPVRIAPATEAPAPTTHGLARVESIEIALANGRILRVCDGIDPMRLARLVAALESTVPIEGGP